MDTSMTKAVTEGRRVGLQAPYCKQVWMVATRSPETTARKRGERVQLIVLSVTRKDITIPEAIAATKREPTPTTMFLPVNFFCVCQRRNYLFCCRRMIRRQRKQTALYENLLPPQRKGSRKTRRRWVSLNDRVIVTAVLQHDRSRFVPSSCSKICAPHCKASKTTGRCRTPYTERRRHVHHRQRLYFIPRRSIIIWTYISSTPEIS